MNKVKSLVDSFTDFTRLKLITCKECEAWADRVIDGSTEFALEGEDGLIAAGFRDFLNVACRPCDPSDPDYSQFYNRLEARLEYLRSKGGLSKESWAIPRAPILILRRMMDLFVETPQFRIEELTEHSRGYAEDLWVDYVLSCFDWTCEEETNENAFLSVSLACKCGVNAILRELGMSGVDVDADLKGGGKALGKRLQKAMALSDSDESGCADFFQGFLADHCKYYDPSEPRCYDFFERLEYLINEGPVKRIKWTGYKDNGSDLQNMACLVAGMMLSIAEGNKKQTLSTWELIARAIVCQYYKYSLIKFPPWAKDDHSDEQDALDELMER